MRTKTPCQAEKILDVAARLFSSHRFHEARMEDIAAAASVGKGTLYRYFKDKDELYLALLSRAADQMLERLASEVIIHTDPRERLMALVANLIDFFDSQPHLFDLIQHTEALKTDDRPFPWCRARSETIRIAEEAFTEIHGPRDDISLKALLLLGGIRVVVRFMPPPRPAKVMGQILAHFLPETPAQPACPMPRSHTLKSLPN